MHLLGLGKGQYQLGICITLNNGVPLTLDFGVSILNPITNKSHLEFDFQVMVVGFSI